MYEITVLKLAVLDQHLIGQLFLIPGGRQAQSQVIGYIAIYGASRDNLISHG